MPETTRAQAIASQVVELKDTEVLILRLPEDLSTSDQSFRNFAAELRAILTNEDCTRDHSCTRAVVLRHDMGLEQLASGQLAQLGLRATAKHPGKCPELLFTSGPLREAARAGWESANGNAQTADVCASTARASLDEELRLAKKMDVRTL